MATFRGLGRLALLLAVFGSAASAGAGGDPFAVQIIETSERTVAAELGDLDGDGRCDLLQVVFEGAPPNETRRVRAYFQRPGGAILSEPDLEQPLPGPAAAFDLADVRGGPGVDLILLVPHGLRIVSFERDEAAPTEPPKTLTVHEMEIPGAATVGAAEDERGLDRLAIASFAFGPDPILIVPGLAETFLLARDGELRARLEVGGRANYLVAAPGPVLAESDIQLFFDPPRIFVGDVDGDGLVDVVASARHEIRVFWRRPDGSYAEKPDQRVWLGLVSEQDHIRGSGAVRTGARDIDADGLLDLLITRSSGSILDAQATSSIYLNRDGRWNLEAPDAQVSISGALSADQLLDIDGDGRLELVQIKLPLSVLELVEMFFSRAIDAHFKVYGFASRDGRLAFQERPIVSRKLDIPLDFNTGRPHGFIPTLDFDFNSDGFRDYLGSTDGSELEVLLGGGERPYARRAGRQALETVGRVRDGDLNGDGLTDLVLYNPRKPGSNVFLLRNRGVLPGTPPTPPKMRAQP